MGNGCYAGYKSHALVAGRGRLALGLAKGDSVQTTTDEVQCSETSYGPCLH